MAEKRIRECRVQPYGDTYAQSAGRHRQKSSITLAGAWLHKVFKPGETVELVITDSAIIITKKETDNG